MQNPQFRKYSTYVIYAHLLRQVATLCDLDHQTLADWFSVYDTTFPLGWQAVGMKRIEAERDSDGRYGELHRGLHSDAALSLPAARPPADV